MALENLKQQAVNLSTDERLERLAAVIQSLQGAPSAEAWQYLVTRAHPWRRQLYIKGRKLLASTVWQDLVSNGMSPEQAAENWDLPLAAVQEAIRYRQTHRDLLKLEAEEEHYRLHEKGASFEPGPAAG